MSTAAIDLGPKSSETTTFEGVEGASERPRFDPFATLTPEQRRREQEGYAAYLRKRDGDIDWEGWGLPVREERTQRQTRREASDAPMVDVDAFYQLFHRVGEPEADRATKWASLIALANENEFYGVEIESRKLRRRGRRADELMVFHVMQEDFHTRLVSEGCRLIGLNNIRPQRPRLLHRLFVGGMGYLTDWLRYPGVLLGETVGAVVFDQLHRHCDLFDGDPAVAQRLREITREIRDDEILHTIHCRSRLPAPMMAMTRSLIPFATWVIERAYPQIRALGMDRHMLRERLAKGIEIPEGVDWVHAG